MANRHPALDELLRSLEAVFLNQSLSASWREEAIAAFGTLKEPSPASGVAPETIPACCHLDTALAIARERGGPQIRAAAAAFAELVPQLAWGRRVGSEKAGAAFHEGHANAIVIGPKGLEVRDDCWLGVTLMAPNVQYPAHLHPPEELYVVLSNGEWFRQGSGWFTPGIGGTAYNPSGCLHSMHSERDPLLAFWLLWSNREVPTSICLSY